jgi:hypothetical protein
MAPRKGESTAPKRPARSRATVGTRRRTTPGDTSTVTKSQAGVHVMPYTEAQIRERAYYIYLERGGAAGDPVADWFQAERELKSPARGTRE